MAALGLIRSESARAGRCRTLREGGGEKAPEVSSSGVSRKSGSLSLSSSVASVASGAGEGLSTSMVDRARVELSSKGVKASIGVPGCTGQLGEPRGVVVGLPLVPWVVLGMTWGAARVP